ncbi:MAG: SDR family oxidoreductase [Candidatus Marinimicrobia bacterium]|nr:SDR family oxidoreductase [Candidatus Neomarinimicrobiota bacterium]
MQKVLVTGGSGFLGSNVVKKLKTDYRVICGYHNFPPDEKNIIKLDFNTISAIKSRLNKIEPEIVIHTAALSKPGLCHEYPEKASIVNVNATSEIAAWCQKNAARLIFTSTDMVYSGQSPIYKEDDQINPVNKYGQTKAAAEKTIQKNCQNFVILRLALMHGRGIYKRNYSSEWLETDLRKKQKDCESEPIGLYTDQYRSMISVKNVAMVLKELIEKNTTGIFNIGGPDAINRYEFGTLLCNLLGISKKLIKPVRFRDINPKVQSPLNVTLDVSKAKNELQTELLPIKEGLRLEYGTKSDAGLTKLG